MITPELLDYIRARFAEGRTSAEVRHILTSNPAAGWQAADVDEAFAKLGLQKNVSPSPPREAPRPAPLPQGGAPFPPEEFREAAPRRFSNGAFESPQPQSSLIDQPAEEALTRTESLPTEELVPQDTSGQPKQPAVVVTESPAAAFEGTVPPQSSSRAGVVLFVVGLLFVAAGGAFAYWHFFIKLPPPADVITGALENFQRVQALSYEGELVISGEALANFPTAESSDTSLQRIQPNALGAQLLEALFGGARSTSGESGEDVFFPYRGDDSEDVITVSFTGKSGPGAGTGRVFEVSIETDASLSAFGELGITLDVRGVDEILYFRLSNLPFVGIDVSEFNGQWFSVDLSSLEELLGATGASTPRPFGEDTQRNLESALDSQERETLEELVSALDISGQFVDRGAEKIKGVRAQHYRLAMTSEDIGAFLKHLKALTEFVLNNLSDTDSFAALSQGTGAQIPGVGSFSEGFDTAADELRATFERLVFDVWVDTGPFLPRQFALRADIADVALEETGGHGPTRLFVRVSLDNFNEPVSVNAPVGARDLVELIEGSFQEARARGHDALVEVTLSTLRLDAELYRDENGDSQYTSFCTTPETTTELAVVDEANGSGRVVCVARSGAYAIAADLPGGGAWCVDSRGTSQGGYESVVGGSVPALGDAASDTTCNPPRPNKE